MLEIKYCENFRAWDGIVDMEEVFIADILLVRKENF